MDWTTIVLGIIIIILIYTLYVFFVAKSSVIGSSVSLKDSNDSITEINSGQSTRYSYGIWVYVNTWDATREKTIFERKENIRVWLAKDEPSLYFTITCVGTNGSSLTDQNILITDNFSIQKWVYIVVSADNTIIDAYLDGKLVNSTKLETSPNQPASATNAPIEYGSGWDCYVAGLQNWSTPIGPQEVWDNYMASNDNSLSRFFGSYTMDVAVNKDNVQQSSYTINF
jgi:hypothetical protein